MREGQGQILYERVVTKGVYNLYISVRIAHSSYVSQ